MGGEQRGKRGKERETEREKKREGAGETEGCTHLREVEEGWGTLESVRKHPGTGQKHAA